MSDPSFVSFLGKNPSIDPPAKYDGYLSFIPYTNGGQKDDAIAHRCIHNRDFFWLEMKDLIRTSPFPLQIETAEDCLWIYIDILGRSMIHISPAQQLSTGEVVCYLPDLNPYTIHLGEGKNWVFMIGISASNFEKLASEYPLVQRTLDMLLSPEKGTILGKMGLYVKLFNTLESLKRIEFRPFSTYYLLMSWNLRLFQIVFNEAKEVKSNEEDSLIALYHKSLSYIREHFNDEGLSLKKIAEAMHVSVRKLTRSFENRPYSVNGYIKEMKLADARERILQSDRTIVHIAFGLHFSCAKHFSRLFKKRYGLSPTELREQMQQKTLFKARKRN